MRSGCTTVRAVICASVVSFMVLSNGLGCIPLSGLDPLDDQEQAEQQPLDTESDHERPPEDSGEQAENGDPTARAGVDQVASGGDIVQLDGRASSDPDGDELLFSWVQTAGTEVVLSDNSSVQPTFVAPAASGVLRFELTAEDDFGGTSSDTVDIEVRVNRPAQLFIISSLGHRVTSYFDPVSVNGNVRPDTNLAGTQTQLNRPYCGLVDRFGQLLVSNDGSPSVTSYGNFASTDGNLEPDGILQGAATLLSAPYDMDLGSDDQLYVVDYDEQAVFVFDASAGALKGNQAPIRTILTATSGEINDAERLGMGPNGDLYVANTGDGDVLVFADAASVNGDVAPSRIIDSAALGHAMDVLVTDDDTLYIVDVTNGQIHTFSDASTLNGVLEPDLTLTVLPAGQLTSIVIDSAGSAYIADYDNNAVYVYNDIAKLNGAFNPDRSIAGAQTQIEGPTGLYLIEE